MNFNHSFSKCLISTAAIYCLMGATVQAVTDISDTPLAVRNLAQPNIMFMLDNSGSMSNIVPEAPFDPLITYLSLGSGPSACNIVLAGGVAAPNFPANESYDAAIRNSDGSIRIMRGATAFIFGATTACFNPALRYNARLLGNGFANTTAQCGVTAGCFRPDGYLSAVYTGNYLNWYFGQATSYSSAASFVLAGTGLRRKAGTQTRLEIAQTSANNVISTLTNARVGLSAYNGTTGGTLLQVVENLTPTKKTALTASVNALTPTGATPLAETLSDIGRYFATGYTGNLKLHPGQTNESLASVSTVFNNLSFNNASGVTTPPAPIQFFCQKSFAVLMTDGRPQQDRAISSQLQDYAGNCAAIPSLCTAAPTATALPAGILTPVTWDNGNLRNGTQVGRSYEGFGSDYLDDVANALFDLDLRPDLLATVTTAPKKNNVATYVIGFADEQVLNDPLLQSTATKGGGVAYFTATQTGLVTAFQNAVASIQGQESAAAAVAVSNANVIAGDNFAYASTYNSGTWTGTLQKRPIDVSTGAVSTTAIWSAHPLLNARTSANRYIATHNGNNGSSGRGIQFQPASGGGGPNAKLTTALQNLLNTPSTLPTPPPPDGANVLAYLRGDKTGEPSTYRMRSSLLGDIINARPLVVNKPSANFTDNGYAEFRTSNAQSNRESMVYQGANDGMLHAFRASDGQEEWAYIPNLVFANLNLRTRTGASFMHRFYVDGSPFSSDVDFNKTPGNNSPSSDWRSILVGGLNKGGFGYYALDITTPILPSAAASKEPAVADKVLWEFPKSISDATVRATVTANTGYSYGTPIIAKVGDGGWVVLLTSGYNNGTGADSSGGNGNGFLYVVDAKTGDLIQSIATSVAGTPSGTAASPSGLAQISAFSENPALDSTVTHVYGGDLKGNVWRFNLLGPRTTWSVTKLATLVDASGSFQPVTTAPRLTQTLVNGTSQRLVFFGTGLYLGDSDLSGISGITPNAHAAQTQTRYGLLDNLGGEITPLRTNLQQQTFPTAGVRTTSNNPVDYATKKGWYLDLPDTGERSVTNSRLQQGTLIFTTIIPTSTTCVPGGSSFLFQLNALTGTSIANFPIISLGNVLASEPVIIQLPNGALQLQISTSGQGNVPQIVVNGVPVPPGPQIVTAGTPGFSAGTLGRRISWRELLTE